MKQLTFILFFNFLSFSIRTNAQDSLAFEKKYQTIKAYYADVSTYDNALRLAFQELNNNKTPIFYRAKYARIAGNIFYINGVYDKALQYRQRSYQLNKRRKDSAQLMWDHAHIGAVYQQWFNEFPFKELHTPKAQQHKDSALHYYLKNVNEFRHIKKGFDAQVDTHLSLGSLYADLDSLVLAEHHVTLAINGFKKLDNLPEMRAAIVNKGLVLIYQKKYPEAIAIYYDLLDKAKDSTSIRQIEHIKICHGNLSYIYAQISDFKKAYEHKALKGKYLNLLYNKQKDTEISRIEAKYKSLKSQQEQALITEQERKMKNRFQLLCAISFLAILIIISTAIILYRNNLQKSKNLQLALLNKELDKQFELFKLRESFQNKIIAASLDGRVKIRKQVTLLLQKEIAPLLTKAQHFIRKNINPITGLPVELRKSKIIIDEACDKMRDLSNRLISDVLLESGLDHAVENICTKYSNEDLVFEFELEGKIPRLSQDFEIKIHNIIEEFCNNIIKHSKASNATIRLHMIDNTIHITVKDNGVGFDTQKLDPKSGIGLSQIKARIESLEGEIDIQSVSNIGTEINIKTPVLLA